MVSLYMYSFTVIKAVSNFCYQQWHRNELYLKRFLKVLKLSFCDGYNLPIKNLCDCKRNCMVFKSRGSHLWVLRKDSILVIRQVLKFLEYQFLGNVKITVFPGKNENPCGKYLFIVDNAGTFSVFIVYL